MKKILAIDLGTHTGWAVEEFSGVEDFTPSHLESKDMRFIHFENWIIDMLDSYRPKIVVYEMPHLRGGPATEVLVGLMAISRKECAKRKISFTSVHSGTLKKHATGKGNASKREMIEAATRLRNKRDIIRSDEADAIMLFNYAKEKIIS